jgi:hypothetical protein
MPECYVIVLRDGHRTIQVNLKLLSQSVAHQAGDLSDVDWRQTLYCFYDGLPS